MAESAYLGSEDTEILRPKMGKTEIFWNPGLFFKQGIYPQIEPTGDAKCSNFHVHFFGEKS